MAQAKSSEHSRSAESGSVMSVSDEQPTLVPTATSRSKGFGFELIEQTLRYELGNAQTARS
jgi:hypothetical protein